MKRPRHKLEVSTFPFLAVLLCAMGAMVLFLLVMDRRSKIVAQAKARDAQAVRVAARGREDAARKAEWEERREALHQTLLAQQAELGGETDHVQKQLADAQAKLEAKLQELATLKHAAELETAGLTQQKKALADKERRLNSSEHNDVADRAELAKLGAEVVALEKALADLKALKRREGQTYSLVPYRGKHGDNRNPLYIECVRGGLIFHPDRMELAGLQFDYGNLRNEVERRAGALERAVKAKRKESVEPEPARGPYVLFLIRPDGISSYYHALSFLKGYQIDFGYEVVDQHWVLDFGPGDQLAGASPWRTASGDRAPQAKPAAGPLIVQRAGVKALMPGNTVGAATASTANPSTGDLPGAPSNLGGFGSGNRVPGTRTVGSTGTGGTGPLDGANQSGTIAAPHAAGANRSAPSVPGDPGGSVVRSSLPGAAGGNLPAISALAVTPPRIGIAGVDIGMGAGTNNVGASNGVSANGLGELGNVPRAGGPSGSADAGAASPNGGAFPGGSATGLAPRLAAYGGGQGAPNLGQPGRGVPGTLVPGTNTSKASAASANTEGGNDFGPPLRADEAAPPRGVPSMVPLSRVPAPVSLVRAGPSLPDNGAAPSPQPVTAGLGGVKETSQASDRPLNGTQGNAGAAPASTGNNAATPPGAGQGAPPATGVPSSWQIPGNRGATGAAHGSGSAGDSRGQDTSPGAGPGSLAEGASPGGGVSGMSPGFSPPSFQMAVPPSTAKSNPRPASPSLGIVLGNRDFVITVTCFNDHVTVNPGGKQHWFKEANTAQADQAVAQNVQSLIAGRQKSVHPGEPPYRPVVRFQLAPDGLRSFLHVYPRLTHLHVPMTRENLED